MTVFISVKKSSKPAFKVSTYELNGHIATLEKEATSLTCGIKG